MSVGSDVILLKRWEKLYALSKDCNLVRASAGDPSANGATVLLVMGLRKFTYRLDVWVGGRVWVGDGWLTLESFDHEDNVTLRWGRRAEPPHAVPAAVPTEDGGKVFRLREQGFYQLAGGAVLGLSNLVPLPGGGLSVSLNCFPPGFEQNDLQPHDIHYRVQKGAQLDGSYCRGKVIDVVAGDTEHRGEVVLEL
jgi:hypothetical protein